MADADGISGLSVQPLLGARGLNWVFLIDSLVCGVLALFFLFYFNRLFATVVGYLIRFWTWHKYRAYIDIQALQISLLGGRIFFKSIRYHAHNITVLVHDGHITWRYWIRKVQDAEIFQDEEPQPAGNERSTSKSESKSSSDGKEKEKKKPRSRSVGKEENAGTKPKKELPCRISVKVSGVEAFIYNRSPAYDIIVEQTMKHAKRPQSNGTDQSNSNGSSSMNEKKGGAFGSTPEKASTNDTSGTSPSGRTTEDKPEIPAWLRMFPIKIECKRAAAAVGNQHTTSVAVAKVEKSGGTIDAGHAGPLDPFKLLFNFDLERINVALKPNRDYNEEQLKAAQRILSEKEAGSPPETTIERKAIQKAYTRLAAFAGFFKRGNSDTGSIRMQSDVDGASATFPDLLPGQEQWHGLTRYLDDKELDEHDEWRDVEYAKASTIADIEKVHLRFYFDMPGKVSGATPDSETLLNESYEDDINGTKPPDYGMDFLVYGGVVTYGPWADRQRINMQQEFFAAPMVDAIPAAALKPGEWRNWSIFKIFVSVEEDVTLRIPAREPSKDKKWQGRSQGSKTDDGPQNEEKSGKKHGRRKRHMGFRRSKKANTAADVRPYAWMDVIVKKDSTVNYIMDMFPHADGYRNKLDLDVKGTEINSSVNHGLLWRTGNVTLEADLSQPVSWNSVRNWPFNIIINDMELFILRDHFFLIIDLVNDWSSGPPPNFYTFVPYIYQLRMLFRNFIIYLNVNDANIVNDPADFDKNDFLTLEGLLDATLDISMEHFRPVRNWIQFDVLSTDMRMRMLSPSRSTFNTLLKDKLVATLPKLTLKGSFSGHMEERYGLTDTLRFDIVGSGLTMKAYGFLVRQLVSLKENYFGDYMHFKTLEEFQGADDDLAVANVKTASIPKPTSINELDVILCIVADDITVLAPTCLYSCDEFVRLEVPVMNLDLRILSYYLDMGLQLSPISILAGRTSSGEDSPVDNETSTQLFIKHLDLDGHRAFGPPPDEPAYVSQWYIDVGAITGECSSSFVHKLSMAARSFAFTFPDPENALPLGAPSVFYEATFVQVKTDIVRIWMHVGKDALLLSLDPIEVGVNDLAGDTFSQRIDVMAPKITVACVDARSASRQRSVQGPRTPIRTYAFFQTGVAISVVERKREFAEMRRKQQEHIRVNDQRTKRFPFLLRRGDDKGPVYGVEHPDVQPPAMQYPYPPTPLHRQGEPVTRPASVISMPSVVDDKALRPKSSSSSLSGSIRANGRPSIARKPTNKRLGRIDAAEAPSSSQSMRSSSRASSVESSIIQRENAHKDRDRSKAGLPSSTVAFSSPFSEPYFPLNATEPDETDVPGFEGSAGHDHAGSDASSIAETINDVDADEEGAKTTVFIQLVPGIRAYVEPRVGIMASKLLRKVLPKSPEEVLDVFTMRVLDTVASKQQQRNAKNSTLELKFDLPAANVRVLNPSASDQVDDQVQLGLRSVNAMVRISERPEQGERSDRLAVHTSAESVDISIGGYVAGESRPPAAQITIDDVLVYVAVSASRSINASVRDTIITVSGDHAEYLTDMILRVMPVALDLERKFLAVFAQSEQKLRFLVYTLTQSHNECGDPTYLSRITYILRAFPEHCRNQESWRVLARLRHILHTLPTKALDDLKSSFRATEELVAQDAFLRTVESWSQERNWDVPNMNSTVAFQMLGCADYEADVSVPDGVPTVVTLRSEYLRLAIESGKSANELIIEDTTFGLERTPPKAPSGLMLVEENLKTKTVVQTHVASIGLSINWSAFDIIETILPLAEKIQKIAPAPKHGGRSRGQMMEDRLSRQTVQVVISTDSGSLSLQSINLRRVSRVEGLRTSLLGTTQAGGPYGLGASLIMNADAAITELHSSTKRVWETVLTLPSVYVDYLTPSESSDMPPSVVTAVAYRELRLAVEEQAPGLAQLVDAVILDEVAKGMKLAESIKAVAAQAPKEQPDLMALEPQEKGDMVVNGPVKVHFALLAGELHFEIALLQELKYQLQGVAASVRIAPDSFHDKTWAIDFDVGRNRHCFVNSSASKRVEQTILDVPPINGHVGLENASEALSLSVTTTMEKVEIDATAIQSLLTVLNRPEVQTVMEEIKGQVEGIKAHVNDIKPVSTEVEKKPVTGEVRSIAFDFRFAFLGVRVATTTPLLKGRSTASVEFGIGPVHVVASNRETIKDSKTLIPEVRAQIRDIGAKLQVEDRKGKVLPCGNVTFGINIHFKSHLDKEGKLARELKVESHGLEVNAYPETAATAVDVINHLQDRIKNLDVSKEIEYLRRLRDRRKHHKMMSRVSGKQVNADERAVAFSAEDLLSVTTTVQLTNIQVAWIVHQSYAVSGDKKAADLVLTLECIEFVTRGGREARLTLQDLQVQSAPKGAALTKRPLNSVIVPEVSFSVAYFKEDKKRSFAFKAAGKPLEVRLESTFMYPVAAAQRSIESAIDRFKAGTAAWESTPTASGRPRKDLVDINRLGSVLVEADFAGTVFYMQGSGPKDPKVSLLTAASQQHGSQHGRYGKFATEGARTEATLKAPGFGMKVEYNPAAGEGKQGSVNGEVRIDASSNSILPSIVPLLLEVSDSVKEVMQSQEPESKPATPPAPDKSGPQRFFEDESIVKADPTAIFGKTKVDLGLRICRQEFALTCQPIAKIDAQANLDDLYITMNTVESEEHGHFFALSATVTKLDAQVKHMYSREPTFTFDMDSIVLSVLNSKHLSGASGISTILKLNPTRTFINGKQVQDLLLFQEIWVPREIRASQPPGPQAVQSKDQTDDYFASRYQSVAAAAAFPWNATVQVAELSVDLDLGQSIGKSSFTISNLWASQAKTSNWEQNLCIGMGEMAVNSTGRMSGFVKLNGLGVRTTIKWPETASAEKKTPLIQASVGFQRLRAKAAFDYQAFAFGDIAGFDFLMYNVREEGSDNRDRLVAVLDCEKAYVFCTSTSPAQAVGLFQAFERLIQEKQTAFKQSLKDIEKHLRRESTTAATRFGAKPSNIAPSLSSIAKTKSSISLHTDVVVTMGAVSFGVFPSTFFDSQILKLEANNIQARFAVGLERGRIHSGLGMTLGQLQVALASVRRITAVPKALDVSVDDVVSSAVNSKGGTILRVPKVVASMETWQTPETNNVDFIFKSLFDGKIDVGWNLSRINFIKGMYTAHVRALASRLGKALPESAVKITAGPADSPTSERKPSSASSASSKSASTTIPGDPSQDKITAEVNLPQSKYEYHPLEPPIIETPQLRDMGEATPPLEWIGLDRQRLPNALHQVVIVSLLEVAKEVEEAYEKILGSS